MANRICRDQTTGLRDNSRIQNAANGFACSRASVKAVIKKYFIR